MRSISRKKLHERLRKAKADHEAVEADWREAWGEYERARAELMELKHVVREAARALVDGGLDYGPGSSGAFIEAVRMIQDVASAARPTWPPPKMAPQPGGKPWRH